MYMKISGKMKWNIQKQDLKPGIHAYVKLNRTTLLNIRDIGTFNRPL